MVGIQYPMRAHFWTHGSSDGPAPPQAMTSSQLIPAKTATPDARRQDLGSAKSDELFQDRLRSS